MRDFLLGALEEPEEPEEPEELLEEPETEAGLGVVILNLTNTKMVYGFMDGCIAIRHYSIAHRIATPRTVVIHLRDASSLFRVVIY